MCRCMDCRSGTRLDGRGGRMGECMERDYYYYYYHYYYYYYYHHH